MKKLNLGCGTDIRPKEEGWINVDKYDKAGVDLVHDLEKTPLPFKANTIDYIYASHVFEHVVNYENLIKDIIRVLKPEGILEVKVPHWSSSGAHCEVHVRFFRWYSFNLKESSTSMEQDSLYRGIRCLRKRLVFEKRLPYNIIAEPIINLMPQVYEHTFLCHLLPAHTVHFILQKKC